MHALERVHRWLDAVSGRLVDIHPVATPRQLTVRVDSQLEVAGELVDEDKFATYQAADGALGQVVEAGLYTLEAEQYFSFLVHLDSLDDLRTYLADGELIGDEMDYTTLDNAVELRAAELLSVPGREQELVLYRPVCIRSLRPKV